MKSKIVVDESILSASVPGPSDDMLANMEHWMRSLPRKEKVHMKKKMSVALVLTLILVLLAITGLAISLTLEDVWQQSFEKMNTSGHVNIISQPEEGDMPVEEAIQIAKEALQKKYGLTEEQFAKLGVYPLFLARGWDGQTADYPARWEVYYSSQQGKQLEFLQYQAEPMGDYLVYINAETGEVTYCNWYTDTFWQNARQIWDAGNYEEVYQEYLSSSFYFLPFSQQTHWEEQLAAKGFSLIPEEEKYDRLLQNVSTRQSFATVNTFLPDTDLQVKAAYAALEETYGLKKDILQKSAYLATRPGWNTGTDDVCIAYRYAQEELLGSLGQLKRETRLLFSYAKQLGSFMVSFRPGTEEVVNIAWQPWKANATEGMEAEGKLLEKGNWNAEDFRAFDAAVVQLEKALQRMENAGRPAEERNAVTQEYILQLGGDPDIYKALPEEKRQTDWFAETSLHEEKAEMDMQALQNRYGYDIRFWPLEVQAMLGGDFSIPRPGEMTREEAVQFAMEAVIAAEGKDALTELGNYVVGCQLHRYENDGEVLFWRIFITDDAQKLEHGWRIDFFLREGNVAVEPMVYPITEEANG